MQTAPSFPDDEPINPRSRVPAGCRPVRPRPVWHCIALRLLVALPLVLNTQNTAFAQTLDESDRALLRSAEEDVAARRYAAGQTELETVIAHAPRLAEAWTELGLLYGRVNDLPNSERALRHSLEIDPEQARAHYLLGLTLIANPMEKLDWPAAIQEFRDAIRLNPNDTDAMDHVGVGLLALDRVDEAVTILQHAIALTPDKASAHFDLGLALERKGDLENAATQYRLALKAKPDYSEASSALGKLLLTQNQLDEAESRLRDALRINPDLQDAHYALGRLLRKQKKVEQAQREFEEAVALDQRIQKRIESSQLSNGALAKAAKGDFTGAEVDLRKAIRLRSDYGVPHYNLGLILADEQKMTEAAQQLSVAISLMPGRAQPWVDLAKVQRLLGDVADARASAAFALQLAPGDAHALEESRLLHAATSVEPVSPRQNEPPSMPGPVTVDTVASHSELAYKLESQADWLDAAGEWLRVLALEPAAETPRLELADCLQHIDDSAAAILEIRKVVLAHPGSVRAHVSLGNLLIAAGSQNEAREQLQQALLLDPTSVPAKASLKLLRTP